MSFRPNHSKTQAEVLVTNGWGRIAYNIVRSLGRRGLKVCVGTDNSSGMAGFSRYCRFTFRHPPFLSQPNEFVESVRNAIRQYSPRVLIPSDHDAYVVARFRQRLEDLDVSIPVAPFDTIRTLHLKDQVAVLGTALGIPVPMTLVPQDLQDIVHFAGTCGPTIVVKRLNSSSARGVYFLDRTALDGLPDWLAARRLEYGSFLLQEYVGGTGYGVSMLMNTGRLRAKFTHKRLAEICVSGGVSTHRVGVVNPQLETYAEALLTHTCYHGVAMVEFRYDEQSGRAWLLEVNPRFWGSVGLAIQSGVDFPYLLFRMATEGDIEPVLRYRSGVIVNWLLGDAVRLARQMLDSKSRKTQAIRASGCHGYDDCFWDDPLVFPAEVLLSVRRGLRTARRPSPDLDVSMEGGEGG